MTRSWLSRWSLSAAAVLLQAAVALAQSNQTPIGALEGVDASGIARGWAADPDTPAPIEVHLYVDGPAGTGTFIRMVSANAATSGQGLHGFVVPLAWRDGLPHTLYAYGIDSSNDPSAHRLLSGSPASFTLPSTIVSIGNGTLQFGIDVNCGGVLAEIRLNGSLNLVNNADCGRQIQAALYDGNASYDQCAGCTGVFGWNPVQGGDEYNFGSPLVPSLAIGTGAHRTGAPDSIAVRVHPYQWNPDDKSGSQGYPVLADVILDQTVSLIPNQPRALNVRYTITHVGADQHSNSTQELPALYLNAEFNRLAYYAGSAPWTGGALTIANLPVHPASVTRYYGSEQWSALVNANNEGLAVYLPGGYPYFTAVSFAGPSIGVYGQRTNYLVPYTTLTLLPNTVYEFDVVLVAGDVATARNVIDALRTAGADSASPVGTIELPAAGATVSGVTAVAGWAFDNTSVSRIDILVDGQVAGVASLGQLRPDVVAAFPAAPPNSGYTFALNTSAYTDGAHTLSAKVYDQNGLVASLPSRTLAVRNGIELKPPVLRRTAPRSSR